LRLIGLGRKRRIAHRIDQARGGSGIEALQQRVEHIVKAGRTSAHLV